MKKDLTAITAFLLFFNLLLEPITTIQTVFAQDESVDQVETIESLPSIESEMSIELPESIETAPETVPSEELSSEELLSEELPSESTSSESESESESESSEAYDTSLPYQASDFIIQNGQINGLSENGILKAEQQLNLMINVPEANSIAEDAFSRSYFTSVSIEGQIRSIGARAFYNSELSNVTIKSPIEYIGDSAFANNLLVNVTETADSAATVTYSQSMFGENRAGVITIDSQRELTSDNENVFIVNSSSMVSIMAVEQNVLTVNSPAKLIYNPTENIASQFVIDGSPFTEGVIGAYMDIHVPATMKTGNSLPLDQDNYIDFFVFLQEEGALIV